MKYTLIGPYEMRPITSCCVHVYNTITRCSNTHVRSARTLWSRANAGLCHLAWTDNHIINVVPSRYVLVSLCIEA